MLYIKISPAQKQDQDSVTDKALTIYWQERHIKITHVVISRQRNGCMGFQYQLVLQ